MSRTINLNWNPAPDKPGETIISYEIENNGIVIFEVGNVLFVNYVRITKEVSNIRVRAKYSDLTFSDYTDIISFPDETIDYVPLIADWVIPNSNMIVGDGWAECVDGTHSLSNIVRFDLAPYFDIDFELSFNIVVRTGAASIYQAFCGFVRSRQLSASISNTQFDSLYFLTGGRILIYERTLTFVPPELPNFQLTDSYKIRRFQTQNGLRHTTFIHNDIEQSNVVDDMDEPLDFLAILSDARIENINVKYL